MVSNPLFRIKPSGKMKREERVIGREGNSAGIRNENQTGTLPRRIRMRFNTFSTLR